MEGRVRSEWEAEQMQVINWVWQGEQVPRLMLRPLAGWLGGWMVAWHPWQWGWGGVGAGAEGMQNSALPHRLI